MSVYTIWFTGPLEDVELRFNQIRRNIRVPSTILVCLCAIGYVFAFLGEQYLLAVALAGLSLIVLSVEPNPGISSDGDFSPVFGINVLAVIIAAFLTVGVNEAFNAFLSATVSSGDYDSDFVKFVTSIIQVFGITVVSLVLAIFAHIYSDAKFEKIRSTIDELKSQLEQLEFLSPKAHAEYCLQYADWVDQGDALALELHNNLNGRKPTVEDFIELSEKIAERDKPESDEDLARKACERLFVG